MATKAELEALLERVEAATIAPSNLDAEIYATIGGAPNTTRAGDRIVPFIKKGDPHDYPQYTASIDAALALVERMLPGFGVSVECHPIYGDWWDAAVFDQMPKTISNARKQTAALALLLALLRALISQSDEASK